MSQFVTVAKVGDIPEGKGRAFTVGDREIAVFLLNGVYYALDDYCPHMGSSLGLSDLWQDTVVCNRHMWAFRLNDGVCIDVPSLKAETFEVRVEGDEIQVCVDGAPRATTDQ
jgi:nitrite reductase (NADH) small subunit/3-phenylpropionate/trans-cinnamate dioxygenase ferredoxin subunit